MGRFHKILEFFEHYSVSWVLRLWTVDAFWALLCFVRFRPLLVSCKKRARGGRLRSVFIEATSLISWQSDTGPSVYDCGLDAVIVRTTIRKGALFSLQRIKVPSFCLDQQEFSFLLLDRMAQISLRLLRLVFSKLDSGCYAHGCF